MSPDLMRHIDYWLGAPLSWCLTLWYKSVRFCGFKNPRYNEPPRNVLFIELAEMGSTVLAYPALRTLKELYPQSSIHFLVFKQNASTADIIDLIPKGNILTIDSSGFFVFVRDTIRVLFGCRKRRIDTVINLEMFARYSAIVSYLTGAKKRVGFHRFYQEGLYTGDLLTHKVAYNPHIHTAQSFITLVRVLAEPRSDVPLGKFVLREKDLWLPKIPTDEAGKRRIWEILKTAGPCVSEKNRIVVLNPNASKLIEVRKWPLDQYAELAGKILKGDGDARLVIIGSASEYSEGEYVRAKVGNERVLNLAGKTTLRELIDLFNIAELLVTNDSGPAHFASLTNIHIMVFFGPETPKLYRPLSDNSTILYLGFACSPCVSAYNQRRTPCNENLCLKKIEVEEVYKKVREVLK